MRITAAIITLNEERNIGRCLASLENVVDEIIVMDSGSTDATEAICKQKGVVFYRQDWLGYAQQKNALNEKASFEMIFSIDADEALSPELASEIIELKSKAQVGYYSLNRLTNYCGSWIYHSGWFPDIKVRLFPKTTLWTGELVHEQLALEGGQPIYHLKGLLHHYSYYSHDQHRRRADHYSTLTAKKYVLEGRTTFWGQPAISAMARFLSMYVLKLGFMDGMAGFHIARISAASNYFKYKEVQRLTREKY